MNNACSSRSGVSPSQPHLKGDVPMKVLIMTLGTRGDIQPFLALAQGLFAAEHEVVLTAPHRFAGFAACHRVPFAGVDDGPMRLTDDPKIAGVLEGSVRARLRQVRIMPAMFTQLLADCWAVASAVRVPVRILWCRPARSSPVSTWPRSSASRRCWLCRYQCMSRPGRFRGPAWACRPGCPPRQIGPRIWG